MVSGFAMRSALIRELLNFLDSDGALRVGNCAPAEDAKLEALNLPLDLKRLLQWSWPQTPDAMVGPYRLRSSGQILAPEDLRRLIPECLLAVGDALNGDLLVVQFSDERCPTGLLSHDRWFDEPAPPAAECFATVTESLEEYFFRVAEQMYLPTDYYAACEWRELRQELNR